MTSPTKTVPLPTDDERRAQKEQYNRLRREWTDWRWENGEPDIERSLIRFLVERENAAAPPPPPPAISAMDPAVIIAGIRRFGLAADGADLRDLEAALAATTAEERPADMVEGTEEARWLENGRRHAAKFREDHADIIAAEERPAAPKDDLELPIRNPPVSGPIVDQLRNRKEGPDGKPIFPPAAPKPEAADERQAEIIENTVFRIYADRGRHMGRDQVLELIEDALAAARQEGYVQAIYDQTGSFPKDSK